MQQKTWQRKNGSGSPSAVTSGSSRGMASFAPSLITCYFPSFFLSLAAADICVQNAFWSCSQPCSPAGSQVRSEEHTSELQSLMRSSYAVFCLQKKNK